MALVRAFGVKEGVVNLLSMHTTCAVFINELQTALLADIKRFSSTRSPRDADWLHNDPEHSDCDRMNADAHLRAMLLGHSLTLQVSGGEVVLGQWQRILMAELDGPRARSLRLQVMGTCVIVRTSRLAQPLRSRRHRREARRRRAADVRRRRAAVRVSGPARGRLAGEPRAREAARRAAPTTTSTSGSRRPTSASPAVCSARSRGCKPGDPQAYTMSLEQVLGQAARSAPISRSPKSTSSTACTRTCRSTTTWSCCAGFKRIRPDIHLKCFTAVEIAFFADLYGMTDEAGAARADGRGARLAARRRRRDLRRARAAEDLPRQVRTPIATSPIHRIAHRLGMRSNVTMLYGHIETIEERVDHMLRTRALQDETGGLPGVHSAGVPSRQQPDAQAAGADGEPTRCACTRWRG